MNLLLTRLTVVCWFLVVLAPSHEAVSQRCPHFPDAPCDILQKADLARLADRNARVSRTVGTENHLRAYRIFKQADIAVPTRTAFPHGIPASFVITATFRNPAFADETWHLLRIESKDARGYLQLTLNRTDNAFTFYGILNDTHWRYLQLESDVFGLQWHTIVVEVLPFSVQFYVDNRKLNDTLKLSLGPMLTDGQLHVARLVSEKSEAAFSDSWIELQTLMFTCVRIDNDPNATTSIIDLYQSPVERHVINVNICSNTP